MSDEKREETLTGIENIEVEPLADEDLESVSGGGVSEPSSNVANACCVSNTRNACCSPT